MDEKKPTIFLLHLAPELVRQVRPAIEAAGAHVRVCRSASCLPQPGSFGPECCLVVRVENLGPSTVSLLREIVGENSQIPVIVVAGQIDLDGAIAVSRMGTADVLPEPISSTDILEAAWPLFKISAKDRHLIATKADLLNRFRGLTKREREVFKRVVEGRSSTQIAQELGITRRTVEVHRSEVMRKMGADNLPHLVKKGLCIDWAYPQVTDQSAA